VPAVEAKVAAIAGHHRIVVAAPELIFKIIFNKGATSFAWRDTFQNPEAMFLKTDEGSPFGALANKTYYPDKPKPDATICL
jgi:hypothetical protein